MPRTRSGRRGGRGTTATSSGPTRRCSAVRSWFTSSSGAKACARSSSGFAAGGSIARTSAISSPRRAHAPPAAVLAQAQDRRAHVGALRDVAQRAVEGCLEEVLGVLDRRRLGRHDDETAPGEQEEVEDVERAARAEIEHDVVDVEAADLAKQHLLLAVLGIGHLEQGLIAAHEPEIRNRGLDHQLGERSDLAGQEMRQGARGRETPSSVWRFAPPRSTSITAQRRPVPAMAAARLAATTDLPTPPLPPPTAQMRGAPASVLARCLHRHRFLPAHGLPSGFGKNAAPAA